jgi:putative glutathione S-transferase
MALPPKLIIQTGRWVWTTLWQVMMANLAPRDRAGSYVRPESEFRYSLGSEQYPLEPGRYRLYVGWSCPWAHRTMVVRSLKGLEDAIALTIVSPALGGWVLEDGQPLAALYAKAQPGYKGRSTVPVLWDDQTQTIVNNESAEIIVMLNAFPGAIDLYPESLRADIDRWNKQIYDAVNNGVYRTGFAQTQAAYESACQQLFDTLDQLDLRLQDNRYLCGQMLTIADVRLFTTLIRFDPVYHGLFKCNRRRIKDYQFLSAYLRDLYQHPGIAATCNLPAIQQDYYGNLFPLNPGGIVPLGIDLEELKLPHGRD